MSGTGYNPSRGYYVALCQVPDDFHYGDNPTTPIAADGSFTTQIHITRTGTNLDSTQVTCAIASTRDHLGLGDRSFDVFIPVSWS